MSGVVHLHRKVVVSLSVGSLLKPTQFFFFGGVILIPSGGSIYLDFTLVVVSLKAVILF